MTRRLPPAYLVALCVVLAVAFGVRTYHLTSNPPELFEDELAPAASIWSLVTTGHDIEDTHLPFLVTRLEIKQPLYFVPTILTQAVLGHTTLAVRLPAALYGVLTTALIAWLMRALGRRRVEALLAAAFFAVVPWAVHYGRIGWEPASTLPFQLGGIGLLWLGLSGPRPRLTAAGVVVLALGAYTYQPALLVNVLLGVTIVLLHLQSARRENMRALLIGVGIAFVILLPYILTLLTEPLFTYRARLIFVFADGVNPDTIWLACRNYLEHWNPRWFFWSAAPIVRIHPNTPLLFASLAPGLLAGLILLLRRRSKPEVFLLIWCVLGALPTGLTNDASGVPYFARGIFALPPLLMITAIGLTWLWEKARSVAPALAVGLAVIFLTASVVEAARDFDKYFNEYPVVSAADWYYGVGAALELADRAVPPGGVVCLGERTGVVPINTFRQQVYWYLRPERYSVIEGVNSPICRVAGVYILDRISSGPDTGSTVVGVINDINGRPFSRLRVINGQ